MDEIDSLNLLIEQYQSQNDSLAIIIESTKANIESINAIKENQIDRIILNDVKSFYDTAWQNLIWFLTAIGALIGLVIPIVTNYIQRSQFKNKEEKLLARIEELSNWFDSKVDNIEEQIDKATNEFQGISYLLINQIRLNAGDKVSAFAYGLEAVKYLMYTDVPSNYADVRATLEDMVETLKDKKLKIKPQDVIDELKEIGSEPIEIAIQEIIDFPEARYLETELDFIIDFFDISEKITYNYSNESENNNESIQE